MKILAVDDELLALQSIQGAILEAFPDAIIQSFTTTSEALRELTDHQYHPEVVFLDIEMPDITGVELAKQIKDICPKTNIIFVTAYSQYAMLAMQQRPSGYVLKPATADKIRDEIAHLRYPIETGDRSRLHVQCFGDFEVYFEQKPLMFSYHKTKELFAYLIDRRGASCDTEMLCAVLWENDDNIENQKKYLRKLIADLSHTLEKIGAGDVFIKNRNSFAIAADQIDCDYYHMLKGDISAVNEYAGEYMAQFDWAVMDAAPFYNHQKK